MQTRQNIVDVNYHVTEYKHMIDSLNLQVKTLQRELTRPHPLSHDPKVTALYQQLKTCSQEEKEMRYSTACVHSTCVHSTCFTEQHVIAQNCDEP